MSFKHSSLFFILNLLLTSNAHSIAYNLKNPEKPRWIIEKSADLQTANISSDSLGGYYYLLVDIQDNVLNQTVFCHYVIKILTNSGVQKVSDISVDYDPSFQSIQFHDINRFRNGERSNELKNHEIKVIQRETEMDRYLYDGELTAYVNLEDIREGDIIEYSFSIQGYNPIYKNNFFKTINLEYNEPVKEIYRRFLVPKNKILNIYYPSGNIQPIIHENFDNKEYIWQNRNVKAHLYDNNTPSWFNNDLRVQVSTLSTWNEVIKLVLPNYFVEETIMNKLKKQANSLFLKNKNDSVYVSIIRFVQDKIRYLGFESGISAYKPILPTTVLDKRYADCKAKALLLCSLLKLYNIEAHPVLVNSNIIKSQKDLIPSPTIFNHTIVQIKLKNKIFYVDPTLSNQGGTYENFYIPNYGLGLVLKENTTDLVKVENMTESVIRVKNFFSMNKLGGPVNYRVETIYSGFYADDNRSTLLSQSIEETLKSYLNFYSKNYPHIRSIKPLAYQDSRDSNLLVVKEEYIIDSMWLPVENSKKTEFTIGALIINSSTSIPASPERIMPYSISYPSHIIEDTYLELPEEWSVSPKKLQIIDSVFSFSYSSEYQNKRIHLNYDYQTFTDFHPGVKFQEFYSNHQRVYDNLFYSLTYNPSSTERFKLSWLAVILFAIVTILGSIIALKIYHNYNFPRISSNSIEIGGWLVLVAIGLAISSIIIFINLFFSSNFFNQNTWATFQSATNKSLYLLFCVEFVYNSMLLVYLILLQFLFYTRRNILPRLIIALYAINAIFLIVDAGLTYSMMPDSYTPEIRSKSYNEIFRAIIGSAIWIPYFIYSKRVKETFTRLSSLHTSHKDNKIFDSVEN